MTDFKETTDAWQNIWLKAQQQYMDAWKSIAAVNGTEAANSEPWFNSTQQWSQWMSQWMPEETQNLNSRLFELGKSYMSMGETLWRLMQKGSSDEAVDWQKMVQEMFPFNKANGKDSTADPWSGFATFWGLPMDTWERFASIFSATPGGVDAFKPQSPQDINRLVRQFLLMPSVGYTREWQTRGQQWAVLALDYNTSVQEFTKLLGEIAQKAAVLYGKKLSDMATSGKKLDSLRAAYDMWVDCGEEAYADALSAKEFSHLQAKMVNALMRLKHHEQSMMDDVMVTLNVPTKREINTAHKRVYQLQREVSALRELVESLQEKIDEPAPATTQTETKAVAPKKAAKKSGAKKSKAQPGATDTQST